MPATPVDEVPPVKPATPGAERSVTRAGELPTRLVALIAALVLVAFAAGLVLGLVVH
jgi:hypothetical protein